MTAPPRLAWTAEHGEAWYPEPVPLLAWLNARDRGELSVVRLVRRAVVWAEPDGAELAPSTDRYDAEVDRWRDPARFERDGWCPVLALLGR